MENNDKFITIFDEDKNEVLAEILFTFESKGDNYVLLTLVSEFDDVQDLDEEYAVLAYKYDELEDGTIGNLIEIPETAFEEWEMIEEMFNTFEESQFEAETE